MSGKDPVRGWSTLAPKLRTAFEAFERAFPDCQHDIVELVEEPPTVVAGFRCTGTHVGDGLDLPASRRSMRVDDVAFIRATDGRISSMWGPEDTWTRMRQLAATMPPSASWDP